MKQCINLFNIKTQQKRPHIPYGDSNVRHINITKDNVMLKYVQINITKELTNNYA